VRSKNKEGISIRIFIDSGFNMGIDSRFFSKFCSANLLPFVRGRIKEG